MRNREDGWRTKEGESSKNENGIVKKREEVGTGRRKEGKK